jgi:hypothetical protein
MIGFPLGISDSEQDLPGIKPGPLGWYTSTLTTGLQEVVLGEVSGENDDIVIVQLLVYCIGRKTTYK